jgi:hypothetical protein
VNFHGHTQYRNNSVDQDQSSNFESQVFKEMCKLLGLHKTRTTSLRPQSDGMVERFNATIENMLASFVMFTSVIQPLHIITRQNKFMDLF